MRLLLIATYELGHQPLHVASPAAALRAAGHEVRCLDLSVQPWDADTVGWADAAALSVPMHTAMRLALSAAAELRRARPRLPVCLYGLYAPVGRDRTVGRLADRVIAGEYEPALVDWADGLGHASASAPHPPVVQLPRGRGRFRLPARELLPDLSRYAHLDVGGGCWPVGYVETTHGCAHRCRHCPIPAVYDGRFRVVGEDVLLDDIAQLVAAGARHITFGDPDFLNGPAHSLRVVRAMHERFPKLSFDCTVKVEHVLRHADLWPELAAAGCLFVVTAVEGVNDRILTLLDKGHTAADAARAVTMLRAHGIEPRPTFLPFTPWSSPRDVAEIVDFVVDHDLVGNVDPVQYTIRLLLPEGSLLLRRIELRPYLGAYDPERLGYRWSAADPAADRLQTRLAAMVEGAVAAGEDAGTTFARVAAAVGAAAGRVEPRARIPAGSVQGRPRLTEPWFC